MATAKPSYSSQVDITPAGLQSLANGSSVATAAQTNASNLYQDVEVTVAIAGTAAATAHADVYLLSSQDNSNFDTQASAQYLGSITLSATPQQRTFSILGQTGMLAIPEYYEIMVVNNTGAALAASGNAIKVVGVNTTIA